MKALVFEGKVVDVAEQEFEVHEDMKWIDAPTGVAVGYSYDGSNFIASTAPRERTYAEKRAREYPPITDYLDGLVKGDQAQIDKYIADCKAVKEKYPKP